MEKEDFSVIPNGGKAKGPKGRPTNKEVTFELQNRNSNIKELTIGYSDESMAGNDSDIKPGYEAESSPQNSYYGHFPNRNNSKKRREIPPPTIMSPDEVMSGGEKKDSEKGSTKGSGSEKKDESEKPESPREDEREYPDAPSEFDVDKFKKLFAYLCYGILAFVSCSLLLMLAVDINS